MEINVAQNWTFNENDQKSLEQLQGFLPTKIYDIHAHIYKVSYLNLENANLWSEGPAEVSISTWRKHISQFLGETDAKGGLFFPAPTPFADLMKENAYIIEQLALEKASRGLILVSPNSSLKELEILLDHPQIVGFKPYHVYSNEQPTTQSSIRGFFPEFLWKMAYDRNAVVMLHIVKDKGIADLDNLSEIREMCTRYPNIKLILAHAARSFHAPNARQGIKKLRGLENVWFDMSGICEPEAIKIILHEFGPRKLIWGSDFPISEMRGRAVTIGDGFAWLDTGFCNWGKALAHPVLVGIESLKALQNSADELGLNAEDLDDIFYRNAARLLLLDAEPENLTQNLYLHAKSRIPGGVQLLSKRPENMAPGRWPAYFREARGCEVWDLDGKHYYDMSTNAVGSCLLGYRDTDVTKAIIRRTEMGSMCTLNPPEEVELADLLCDIHPWAEQVRFVRGGGEACAVAIRIARATTDRSIVAICGYHGWHDWYLAANLGDNDTLRGHLLPGLNPLGVPVELRGTTVTFRYNDLQSFKSVIDLYGSRLAAIIMEPCRNIDPEPGFLEFIRDATQRCGALLIFDEITVGWRLNFGGAHLLFGVIPDIAVFAKAMGNGTPMGAVIGTRAAMEAASYTFISSTYWTESSGPVAALATLQKMGRINVPAHVAKIGDEVMKGWRNAGEKYQLPIITSGFPSLAHFNFQHTDSEKLRTLYTQMMLDRGFLAGLSIYPTLAHTEDILQLYNNAIEEVFGEIADAFYRGSIEQSLKGKVALSGFARLI